jgi:NAD(P)-dependent dehydrogenase (short-subunit alcohol dehydrogenase family)
MGEQRIAVITGGGRGIGAAIARRFAAAKMKVVITGRDEAKLAEVAKETGARAIRCDVTDRPAIARLAKEVGRADVLVNNAGVAPSAPFTRTDDETWDSTIATNLTGTFLCTKAFLPGMLERGWGRVINVASVAGKIGFRYTSAYCASKAGVLGLTRSLALEVSQKGITVNAVCPGWVESEMSEAAISNISTKTKLTREQALRTLADQSPQRRLMTADEVAALVEWLAGDEASSITAQAINLDGGGLQS